LHLEKGLLGNPRGLKKILDLIPGILQRSAVVDLVNKHLKKRKKH